MSGNLRHPWQERFASSTERTGRTQCNGLLSRILGLGALAVTRLCRDGAGVRLCKAGCEVDDIVRENHDADRLVACEVLEPHSCVELVGEGRIHIGHIAFTILPVDFRESAIITAFRSSDSSVARMFSSAYPLIVRRTRK